MACRVLVTPRSFGKANPQPMEMLVDKGYDIISNPYGRILTKEEMIHLIEDVDAVIVGVDPLDKDVIQRAHKLKVISKYGVGTDNIDLAAAASRNIPVLVTNGANVNAVADYAFALMLTVARKVLQIDTECRKSNWTKVTTLDISNKTLGLIGLGNIGKAVAKRAQGFDMKVIAYDVQRDVEFSRNHRVAYATFQEVIENSDFISLHLPLTPDTRHIIADIEFEQMKSTAILVNTARGGLIDENALLRALTDGRIWGAGIDVFEQEPPVDKRLLQLSNIVIGSHCAASTFDAINNMGTMAVSNLIQHL